MPFNVGPGELILVLVIVLIIFGPGKLPDIGSAIGKGVREFRKASTDLEDSIRGEPTPTPTGADPEGGGQVRRGPCGEQRVDASTPRVEVAIGARRPVRRSAASSHRA